MPRTSRTHILVLIAFVATVGLIAGLAGHGDDHMTAGERDVTSPASAAEPID